MNILIYLRFDGTNYRGWQIQSGLPTIQGTVSDALAEILGRRVTVTGCGRTDSGVHARSYTATFSADTTVPTDRIPYALNAHLPDDIICFGAEEKEEGFTANRSAKAKTYRYLIDNTAFGDVFLARYAWHFRHPLDVGKMRRAAAYFTGTHDFIGFAASGFSVKTTVRTIYALEITAEKGIITIDVKGNGFLYNMVRIIVGTLAAVGGGRIDPDSIPEIINSRRRERAGITAPARGLCLKEVFY